MRLLLPKSEECKINCTVLVIEPPMTAFLIMMCSVEG